MKNKKILPIIILAFILLLGGAYLLYTKFSEGFQLEQLGTQQTDSSSEASGQEKQLAPDFTVYDKDGREVQLSDYFGKPIVLNFWASWCGPCQSEMPEFDEKYRELAGNVEFLMVNMTDGSRETLEIASSYVNKEGFSFPVLYDQSIDAATTYSVYSLPTTYFIDKDGYLTAQASGSIEWETLQKGNDMIYVP